MNKLVLIGKNISHSKSPELYNDYFSNNNLECNYSIEEIENLDNFIVKAKNGEYFAFNVTMPYKIEILKYLDNIDSLAEKAGSCNLVLIKNGKLIGYNTDGIGFYNGLISNNISTINKNICIIGTGGAAKSIASAASKFQIRNQYFINHKTSNAIFNNINCTEAKQAMKYLIDSNIIVNATPVGFSENNGIPLPKEFIDEICQKNKNFDFIDIIYYPKETKIMNIMKINGVKNVLNGEPMLYHQFLENIKILSFT